MKRLPDSFASQTLAAVLPLVSLVFAAGCAAPVESDGAAADEEHLGQTEEALATTGNGISTCGPAHNERCDAKVPVKISDTRAILLGKYDITAGRFRDFANSTGGNFRGYIAGHKPTWWNGIWKAALASPTPTGVGNFWADVGGYGYDWSVWLPSSTGDVSFLLGPYNFGWMAGNLAATGASGYSGQDSGARPAVDWSMYGPGNEGCGVSDYGARTYWQPNGTFPGENNQYGQSVLDKKALNCVSFYLLAAFCAWDGGRLPTTAELNAAWGAETYPWGETKPFYADFNGTVVTNGPKDLANYGNAGGAVYASPATVGTDMSNHLSIPGDFPKGNGPYGHADLAGLVINLTGDVTQGTAYQNDSATNTTVAVTNAPLVSWYKNGSWQGHQIGGGYQFIPTNRYIAAGGRCAYDQGAPAASAFPMGFRAEYFSGTTLAAANSKGVRVDPYIAFTGTNFANPASSSAATPYSVRWTANVQPRYTQTYTFKTVSGDGVRVWVNGQLLINDWATHATPVTHTATIALTAGVAVPIKVEHFNAGTGTSTKLLWSSTTQREQVVPAATLTPVAL